MREKERASSLLLPFPIKYSFSFTISSCFRLFFCATKWLTDVVCFAAFKVPAEHSDTAGAGGSAMAHAHVFPAAISARHAPNRRTWEKTKVEEGRDEKRRRM